MSKNGASESRTVRCESCRCGKRNPQQPSQESSDAVCTHSKTEERCDATKGPHQIPPLSPKHLDSPIGTYRTDAPTTSSVAVHVAVTLALSLDMSSETLDVIAASYQECRSKDRFMSVLRTRGHQLLVNVPIYAHDSCCRFRKARMEALRNWYF